MYRKRAYPASVWITTITIAPIFIIFGSGLHEAGNQPLQSLFMCILAATVISFPSFLIFIFLYRYLLLRALSVYQIKLLLFLATCFLIFMSFLILFQKDFFEDMTLILMFGSYAFTSVIAIFSFPILR